MSNDPTLFFMCETWHSYSFRHHVINNSYNIIENFGARSNTKGRLKTGYVIGYKKILQKEIIIIDQTEQYCTLKLVYDQKPLYVTFAYLSPACSFDISKLLEPFNPFSDQHIIIGDLNSRIDQFQCLNPLTGKSIPRRSKDRTKNTRGRDLISHLNNSNYFISNGYCSSDALGEYTFCSYQGQSVIDLCIASQNLMNRMDLRVLDYAHTNHFPISVELFGKKEQSSGDIVSKIVWDPNKCTQFNNKLHELTNHKLQDISSFCNSISEAATHCGLVRTRHLGTQKIVTGQKWFDSQCAEMKKETSRRLRRFRKATSETDMNTSRLQYLQMRRSYQNCTRAKRTKFMNTLTTQLSCTKNAREFYSALSYFRPKFSNVHSDDKVSPEEFKSFYGKLFSDPEQSNHIPHSTIRNEMLDSDFNFVELNKAIHNLSSRKAPGSDGIINEVWKNLHCLYALFIDLSKAFDSFNYQMLWGRLESIGLSTKFINVIKCMYANARGVVRTSKGYSGSFAFEKGVLQGETLSPRLFTIVMDQLVDILHSSNIPALKIASKDIHILLYADDIVVLATNVFDLQDKIELIRSFFTRNRLEVNLGKTKLVIFKDGRRKKRRPNVYWGDNLIEIVDNYTYLGVTFYENCSFNETCNNFLNKAKCAESQLHKLVYKSSMKSLSCRISLFNSLVRSIIMYCAPIWGIKLVDKLESFQSSFLRKIFGLPRKTPQWYLRLESSCDRIELFFIKNVLGFWKRIMCKPSDSLIRVCYDALQSKIHDQYMKWNWVRDMVELLAKWDCETVIRTVTAEDEIILRGAEISECLGKIKVLMNQQDIIRMNVSTSIPSFKLMKTHIRIENFLNSSVSWSNIRIIVQLRANMSEIDNIKLNDLQCFCNKNQNPNCECCDMEKTENLFHFVFECSRYATIRSTFLSNYCPIQSESEYMYTLSNPDHIIIKDFCNYVKQALRLRSIVLEPT
jgi:hypothetical protein